MAVNDLITFRKGTATQWSDVNPVLSSGEPGYDLTNGILKIGDGVSNWVALSGIGSSSVGGSFSSVGVRGIISTTGTLTSFAVSGGYPVGYLDLFQDGVKLVSTLDFSATDGSNVTLSNSVPSGTVLEYLTMASGVTSGGGSTSLPSNISGTLSVDGDSSYGSVVLLLHGNAFTDSSSYNRTVTSYGGVAATGTAKYGVSSYSLSSVGDYLGVPSSTAFSFGTGDFTLEAWIRPTNYPQDNAEVYVSTIFGRQQSGDHCFRFDINGTSSSLTGLTFVGFPDNGNGSSLSANYSFLLNTWYHIAVSRISGILYLFVNGTLLNSGGTSFTTTIKDSSNEMRIGALNFDSTYKFQFFGLIADARITKGIGRYSSTFTAPTSEFPNSIPYTLSAVNLAVSGGSGTGSSGSAGSSGLSWSSAPASSSATGTVGSIAYDNSYLYIATATNTWKRASISSWSTDPYASNVSLLLHFDGNLTDSSTTPKTATAFGNLTTTGMAKFGTSSLALDGSGDYITVPSNTEFDLGTSYTIECWIRPADGSWNGGIVSRGTYTSSSSTWEGLVFSMRRLGSNDFSRFYFYATANSNEQYIDVSNSYFPANQWTHVAMVRSGTSGAIYVNGVSVGTISGLNTNAVSSEDVVIGAWLNSGGVNEFFNGLIDDVRITRNIARTITVPTESFPNP
jgi:hypothetical protein